MPEPVPFESLYGRAQVECPRCHQSDSTGAWCAAYQEHPGLCCECFDEQYRKSPHGDDFALEK